MAKVYVGPFVRCRFTFVEVVETIRACTNGDCDQHTVPLYDAFCSRCGFPVGDVTVREQGESVDDHELQMQMRERLFTPTNDPRYVEWSREHQTHIWVPNIETPWRDGWIDPRVTPFSPVVLTLQQQIDEVSQFLAFFQHELALLWRAYGMNNVRVEWGVF